MIDANRTPPVPRYFMLNDRSGFRALALSRDEAATHATHEDTLPAGSAREVDVRDFSLPLADGSVGTGQLIRMVNVGGRPSDALSRTTSGRCGATDVTSPNGRHVDAEGHVVLQQWEDVVELNPLDRKEVVLPLKRPPEVVDQVWDARDEDWVYPMHCHAEPSQTAAGGLYPGGLAADWTLAAPGPRQHKEHTTYTSQVAFAANQPRSGGSPATESRQQPDKTFVRKFYNRRLRFPDRQEHTIWSFEDEKSGRRFPAHDAGRRGGHGPLQARRLQGTAHPASSRGRARPAQRRGRAHLLRGDRVLHLSVRPQVGEPGNPNLGSAGTYFYHCHVNTVLHVQLGMVGPLIIDPVVHPDFPVPAGARRPFVDGPLYDVATEALVAPYAVDPRWHSLSHAAGLSGEDVGLNRFDPKFFYVVGGALSGPPTKADVAAPGRLLANTPATGYPTLLRLANLNYFPTLALFTDTSGARVPMAELIAHDGRAYRDTSRRDAPSPPVRDSGRPLLSHAIAFGAAERYDVLLHPPSAGTFLISFEFRHWARHGLLATRSVPIIAR